MIYGKKYMFVACAALLVGMQSCDLEEYNPAGSTPDNVYKEQAGFAEMCIRDRDYIQHQTFSYALRFNYSYKGRYMLTVSNRWDGDSRLRCV